MKFSEGGRRLALTNLLAALAEPGLAGKLTDKEHAHIEEPRTAGVPSDEVLEAAGAVIGHIDIDIDIDFENIFDPDDPRENSGLYQRVTPAALINQTHMMLEVRGNGNVRRGRWTLRPRRHSLLGYALILMRACGGGEAAPKIN